jgi:hypothetical protein
MIFVRLLPIVLTFPNVYIQIDLLYFTLILTILLDSNIC